ncbi:MAG: hypothetical protein R3B91_17120 [Planctomycetaceae bacterium]
MPSAYTVPSAGIAHHIDPKRNATHLGTVLDELAMLKASGETGLVEALHEAAEKVPQRALFVIISDLFVNPEELGRPFSIYGSGNTMRPFFICWSGGRSTSSLIDRSASSTLKGEHPFSLTRP